MVPAWCLVLGTPVLCDFCENCVSGGILLRLLGPLILLYTRRRPSSYSLSPLPLIRKKESKRPEAQCAE